MSNGAEWDVTNRAPQPFTVTYTPELSADMSPSIITYPSKGGANENTVSSYDYNVKVSVKLTDSFRNKSASFDFNYSYQFVCFVVPCESLHGNISSDPVKVSESAIYTAVTQGNYKYSDWTKDNVDTGSPLYSAVANGLTNIFVINLEDPYCVDFNIDMHNIDFKNNPSEFGYKIIVWGNLINLNRSPHENIGPCVGDPKYFDSTKEGLSFMKEISAPIELNRDDNTGGEVIGGMTPIKTVNLYEYYTDYSPQFNYASDLIPTYEKLVKTDRDGKPVEIGTKPLDFKNIAFTVTDNSYGGGDTGGSHDPMTPDDFDEYVKNWEWSENFNGDFGVGTITDLSLNTEPCKWQ